MELTSMARAASSRLSGRRPSTRPADGWTRTYTDKRANKLDAECKNSLPHRTPRPPPHPPHFRSHSSWISLLFWERCCGYQLPDPSKSKQTLTSSPPPSCPSKHDSPPRISGQHNEPAAPSAAEITVEEANSSLPGIHIVAALQWDGLRQISSWRLEGWIWWSHKESGDSSLPLSPSLHLSLLSRERDENRRKRNKMLRRGLAGKI